MRTLGRRAVACLAVLSLSSGAAAEEASPLQLVGPPGSLASTRPAQAVSMRPPERMRGWKLDSALIGVGQIGDLTSTEIALSRPGTEEANPLLEKRGVRIPVKLAVAVGGTLLARELRKQGHGRSARVMSILLFAVGAVAAGHNLRVAGAD